MHRCYRMVVGLWVAAGVSPFHAPAGAQESRELRYRNPVSEAYLADPFVLRARGAWYAYGTGPARGGRCFTVLRSTNFTDWTVLDGALDPLPDPAIKDYWAPEVAERDGRFYLYYAANGRMRVAAADRPEGPFRDAGKDLFPDEPFSIDGHPFRDPQSGRWFLFFAKDFLDGPRPGTALAVAPLADDMVSVAGPSRSVLRASADWQIYLRNRTMYKRVFDAWHTVEGPFVVFRDGTYTCFYSGGNWQTPGYGVGFATAKDPMGPYTETVCEDGAPVLSSRQGGLIGPGHNSAILGPDGQTWFLVYHSWDAGRKRRQMCMDPILWTPDGPRVFNAARGDKTVRLPLETTPER